MEEEALFLYGACLNFPFQQRLSLECYYADVVEVLNHLQDLFKYSRFAVQNSLVCVLDSLSAAIINREIGIMKLKMCGALIIYHTNSDV